MNMKMLVLFAHWCPKCNMMMALVDEMEIKYGDRLQIVRLEVEEDSDIMEKYQAEIVPTFLFYKDDIEVGRMAGMIGEKIFYERVEFFLKAV